MKGLTGAGHGSVDPLVGAFDGLEHKGVGQVYIYLLPLAALGLMAGDGVAVVATQGVEVGVEAQSFGKTPRVFLGDAFLFHAVDEVEEEGLLLHLAEVDSGGGKGVFYHEDEPFLFGEKLFDLHFAHGEAGMGYGLVGNADHLHHVAVHQAADVILHHHQQVAFHHRATANAQLAADG